MASKKTISQQLYDLLVSRDFDPSALDLMGKSAESPADANLFSFEYKTPNKNYGTIVILIDSDSNMEVYFGDNLGKTMETDDRKNWYDFLYMIRMLAKRNLLTFSLNNLNKLKYNMKTIAAITEGKLLEGYYGTSKTSYSNQPKKTKLVIKHNRPLGEGEQRFRNIQSLFVETEEGERFKLPFTNLTGGKIMARHVAEGGKPYDAFGEYIAEMMTELATLSRFTRATRNKTYGDDAQTLAEQAVEHYNDLKRKAKRMISRRGYHEELENYDPITVTELDETVDAVREIFVQQSLDDRIEEALPFLAGLALRGAVGSMLNKDDEETIYDDVKPSNEPISQSDYDALQKGRQVINQIQQQKRASAGNSETNITKPYTPPKIEPSVTKQASGDLRDPKYRQDDYRSKKLGDLAVDYIKKGASAVGDKISDITKNVKNVKPVDYKMGDEYKKQLTRLGQKVSGTGPVKKISPDQLSQRYDKIKNIPFIGDKAAADFLKNIQNDPRVESKMKEVDAFESWADDIVEGTWAIPDRPEEIEKLKTLMAEPLAVGPDASNATEQLYGIFGDDQLFDDLEELAAQDPDADARPVIQARLEQMGISIEDDAGEMPPSESDLEEIIDIDSGEQVIKAQRDPMLEDELASLIKLLK